MIQPKARKVKCKKCGYSMIKQPKSDCLGVQDLINKCPKCDGAMTTEKPNVIDKVFIKLMCSKI